MAVCWPGASSRSPDERREVALLAVCAGILAWLLFLPPFIGVANNGDFSKVAGRLCIGDPDNGADNFLYFRSDYVRGPRYCWNSGVPSAEIVPAWIAALGHRNTFDIRWLGAVHGLAFLLVYFLWLLALRPLGGLAWLAGAAAALWIFADVSSVSYFNSFYSDTVAVLGALAATAAAVQLAGDPKPRPAMLASFGVAALLFITSKGQHGAFGWLPAGFAFALAWRTRERRMRLLACATGALLLAGMAWIYAATPDWYTGQSRFNLVFFKIATRSATPERDLRELGLGPGDLRYVGMHAFTPGSPAADPAWMAEFCRRSTYGGVLRFYLRHPGTALSFLAADLRDEAWQRRAVNLSNFRKQDGHPAGARARRYSSWSNLRTRLFRQWPWHIVLWHGLVLLTAVFVHTGRHVARVAAAVSVLAIGEFCLASLADACETYRHLMLFHVLTDVTLFLGLLWGLNKMEARRWSDDS